MKKISIKKVAVAVLVLLLVVVGWKAYNRGGDLAFDSKTTEITEAQKQEVLKRVSKLIMIPQGTPVVAAITNADQLKSQQGFFQGAETGDVLILVPESSKAIIYSPSKNIIVNSGPIQPNSDSATSTNNR